MKPWFEVSLEKTLCRCKVHKIDSFPNNYSILKFCIIEIISLEKGKYDIKNNVIIIWIHFYLLMKSLAVSLNWFDREILFQIFTQSNYNPMTSVPVLVHLTTWGGQLVELKMLCPPINNGFQIIQRW